MADFDFAVRASAGGADRDPDGVVAEIVASPQFQHNLEAFVLDAIRRRKVDPQTMLRSLLAGLDMQLRGGDVIALMEIAAEAGKGRREEALVELGQRVFKERVAGEIMGRASMVARPGTVDVAVLPPVPTRGLGPDDVDDLSGASASSSSRPSTPGPPRTGRFGPYGVPENFPHCPRHDCGLPALSVMRRMPRTCLKPVSVPPEMRKDPLCKSSRRSTPPPS